MIYRKCPRCGKQVEVNKACACTSNRHKEYDRQSRNQESKTFYNSADWIRARAAAMNRCDGIDVYLYMTEGIVVPADTVHHIIPLREDRSKATDINNLLPIRHATHEKIEKQYKDSIAKRRIIRQLNEMLQKYLRING
ncbi:MAG: HNH endonuclease [Eubacteriales bacterium]|nr:HNH endonuclease [Eubacteriales bacterium]